jgi:uncharacterized protein YdhG (YjbR/CyaY superfamily)
MAFQSVDQYIAAQPEASRSALEQVRRAILTAVPAAEENISYNMPAYTLDGAALLYFSGWKTHYSLYPAGADLLGAFRQELAAYRVVNSTIRFPLSAPVPVKLIARIAKFRAAHPSAKRRASAAAPEKRQRRKPNK